MIQEDYSFGNRCGHDPTHFRVFTAPIEHKQRPWILRKAIYGLKVLHEKGQRKSFKIFIKRLSKLNLKREKRSERLEGISLLLQVVLHYTDLSSFRVGVPNSTGFFNLTLDFLANKANLTLKRAQRAMADLIEVDYVRTKRQTKKIADGEYLNLAAIRQVSTALFADLGIDLDRLRQERHKVSGRKKEKAMKDRYSELTAGKNIKTAADHLKLLKEIVRGSFRLKKPP